MPHERALKRRLDGCVGEDDVGRLAAQFEDDRGEVLGGRFLDCCARNLSACKPDAVDAPVTGEKLSHLRSRPRGDWCAAGRETAHSSSAMRASSIKVSGASAAGLITRLFPAANAGAMLLCPSTSGRSTV